MALKTDQKVERRILALSQQNPDFGPRRLLSLLNGEDIRVSQSTVYRILRRNGLQTREKRLLALKGNKEAEVAVLPESAAEVQPSTVSHVNEMKPESRPESLPRPVVAVRPRRNRKRFAKTPWLLKLLNSALVLLLIFQGLQALQNLLPLFEGAPNEIFPAPMPKIAESETAAPTPAFNAYRAIWERNLFNAGDEGTARLQETIAHADIPAADETLGLELVGTVVADGPGNNFAIIVDPKTRSQALFHEGDPVDRMIVRKILRHRVIVATAEGNRLLAMNDNQPANASRSPQAPASLSEPATSATEEVALQVNPEPKEFRHEDVEAYLADTDQILRDVEISPFKRFNQSVGIRFDDIPSENILAEIGLHSGDVIVGVNDLDITGPNQASELFRALTQKGEVTILLQRRLSTHRLRLKII